MKECSKCNEEKEESSFFKDSSRLTGYSYICKNCKTTGKPVGGPSKGRGQATFNVLYNRYKGKARTRGYAWNLTKLEFSAIIKEHCHYCGIEPSRFYQSPGTNGGVVYNGVDRVDNTEGYTSDNIVACCTECNQAKMDRTEEVFRAWVKRAYLNLYGEAYGPKRI